MKVNQFHGSMYEVVLSRRNLLALLAKLDGAPNGSAMAIMGGADAPGCIVRAEEDDVHYGDRPEGPGPMHPDTEDRIQDELAKRRKPPASAEVVKLFPHAS
jgi:hypothetical protein